MLSTVPSTIIDLGFKAANSTVTFCNSHRIEIAKCGFLPFSVCLFYGYDKNYFLDPDTTGRGIAFVTVVNTAIYTISYHVIQNILSKLAESKKEKQLIEKQRTYRKLVTELETIHNRIRTVNVKLEEAQLKNETDVQGLETKYKDENNELYRQLQNTNTEIDKLIGSFELVETKDTGELKPKDVQDLKRALLVVKGLKGNAKGFLDLSNVNADLLSARDQLSSIQNKIKAEGERIDTEVEKNKADSKKKEVRNHTIEDLRKEIQTYINAKEVEKSIDINLWHEKNFRSKQLNEELFLLEKQIDELSKNNISVDVLKREADEAKLKYHQNLYKIEQVEKDVSKAPLEKTSLGKVDEKTLNLKLKKEVEEFLDFILHQTNRIIVTFWVIKDSIEKERKDSEKKKEKVVEKVRKRIEQNDEEIAKNEKAKNELKDKKTDASNFFYMTEEKKQQKLEKIGQEIASNTKKSNSIQEEKRKIDYFFLTKEAVLTQSLDGTKNFSLEKKQYKKPDVADYPAIQSLKEQLFFPTSSTYKSNGIEKIQDLLSESKTKIQLLLYNIEAVYGVLGHISSCLGKLKKEELSVKKCIESFERLNIAVFEDDFNKVFVKEFNDFFASIKNHRKMLLLIEVQKGSEIDFENKKLKYEDENEKLIKRNSDLQTKRERVKELKGYYDDSQQKKVEGLIELKKIEFVTQQRKAQKNTNQIDFQMEGVEGRNLFKKLEDNIENLKGKFLALSEKLSLRDVDAQLIEEKKKNAQNIKTNQTADFEYTKQKEALKDALNGVDTLNKIFESLVKLVDETGSEYKEWKEARDAVTQATEGLDQRLPEIEQSRNPLSQQLAELRADELKKGQEAFKASVDLERSQCLEKTAKKCGVIAELYDAKFSRPQQSTLKWIDANDAMTEMHEAKIALAKAQKMHAFNLLKLGEDKGSRANAFEFKHQLAVLQYQRHLLFVKWRVSGEMEQSAIKAQMISSIMTEIECIYQCYDSKIARKKISGESGLDVYLEKCAKEALIAKFELILTMIQIELERRTISDIRKSYDPANKILNYLKIINGHSYLSDFRSNLASCGYENDLEKKFLDYFNENNSNDWVKNISQIQGWLEIILTTGLDKAPHPRIHVIKAKIDLIKHLSSKQLKSRDETVDYFVEQVKNPYNKNKYRLKKAVETAELGVVKLSRHYKPLSVISSLLDDATKLLDPKKFIYYLPVVGLGALYYKVESVQKWPSLNAYVSRTTAMTICFIMATCHYVFQSTFPSKATSKNHENALEMN